MSSNMDPHEQEEKIPAEEAAQSEAPGSGEQAAEAAADNGAKSDKKDKKAEKAEKKAEKKLSACEEQLNAERDRYLRLLAEYDNYRKRSTRERENIYSDALTDTVTKFLPVYDNLVRALEQSTADEAYRKGVEMTMNQLRDILAKLGVTEIEAVGQKFDPALHNAVMHLEDDQYGEGEIVLEFEKGFKLGDKVIRFSMVQVAN